MTERQVWLKLAEMVKADIETGSFDGLCLHMYGVGAGLDVCARMRQRLWAAAKRALARRARCAYDGYAWPLNAAGHRKRIAFCKRQVARIDRERRRGKKK